MDEIFIAGETVFASITEERVNLTDFTRQLDYAVLEPDFIRQLVESLGVVRQLASPVEARWQRATDEHHSVQLDRGPLYELRGNPGTEAVGNEMWPCARSHLSRELLRDGL